MTEPQLLDVGGTFAPSPTPYLLHHSVGRPLRDVAQLLEADVLVPWRDAGIEPWDAWLACLERFCDAIASLLGGQSADVCPQVGVSGGMAKLLPAIPRLGRPGARVLLTECDFPSVGYAVRASLPEATVSFVPATAAVSDPDAWLDHLVPGVDLVVVTHAWSNTGQRAPVRELVARAREVGAMVVVDAAQSAGILPLDVSALEPDAVLGSCVKWLCGGPGAGWLWVHPDVADTCQPRDVGWFSHEAPFAFDIHDFRAAVGARRFWGGTPSVLPYAVATRSVGWFCERGVRAVRDHNLALLGRLHDGLGELLASPRDPSTCSGTAVLDAGPTTETIEVALADAGIAVDRRATGLRISPHVSNRADDVDAVIDVVRRAL